VPTVVSPERRYSVLCFKPFFPGLGSIKVKKQQSVGEHLNLLCTHTLGSLLFRPRSRLLTRKSDRRSVLVERTVTC
jgi:hypothetical protein